MVTENEYAELGLAPGATEREVKAAWRRLVSQWHPDRNPSDAALGRMQRINQAFETIRLSGFPSVCAPAESAPRAPRRERSTSPPAASSRAAPPASAPAPWCIGASA